MSYNSYNSSNIKILKGLEAVRKRPGMYIGDTSDNTGVHNMVFEIVDNSIDESLSGFCNNIIVTLYKDNSISVLDDGRGIPVDIHKETGIPGVELIMTVLHTGGKFDNNSYNISGGLHGVGVSVVNALSKKLEIFIYKNNKIFNQIYLYGKPKDKLKIIGDTNKHGTFIRFWVDEDIFINFKEFNYKILFKRFNELSYLNKGLNIKLIDLKKNKSFNFLNNGGIKSYLSYLIKNKKKINENIFYIKKRIKNIKLEFVCQWINTWKNKILCFTNNIFQKDGGMHLLGLKIGITRTINNYLSNEVNIKNNKLNIIGDDIREGLYAILLIKMCNPKFSSQTKEKLISSEVKFLVESVISKNLLTFFLEHPIDSKNIIKNIINSSKHREYLKKSKELFKKKINLDLSLVANKLADCQKKNSNLTEIFLVEGDSAGGSAKQSRNRKYQAVLPLKGKVINVEKIGLEKILFSKEINILISVLGCGIKNRNFDLKKLRYNNIIIMTDADIDGAHIRTLLLTFFYRYMPDIINNGHLYIARPPLYRLKFNKKEYFLSNENELIEYKINFSFKNINLYYKDVILLKNIEISKLAIKYLIFLSFLIKNKSKFSIYLLNSFIYFKDINNINNLKSFKWLKDFIIYLNRDIFFRNKIKYNLLNKNNNYILRFIYIDIYNYEIININYNNLVENFLKLFNIGKKLYFFNDNNKYIKYIYINNKKVYFNNFYNLINYVILNNNNILIQRYKGLGEMNPDQLWNTTMNPKNRNLSKVYIGDIIKANNLFKTLMGDNIKSRKIFIKKNIKYNYKFNI